LNDCPEYAQIIRFCVRGGERAKTFIAGGVDGRQRGKRGRRRYWLTNHLGGAADQGQGWLAGGGETAGCGCRAVPDRVRRGVQVLGLRSPGSFSVLFLFLSLYCPFKIVLTERTG
jgi:hypothetical protein